MATRIRWTRPVGLSVILLSGLSSCREGGEASGDSTPSEDPIADSLSALGVDVTETDRIDDEGDSLPERYSPLGPRADLGMTRELLVVGVSPSLSAGDSASEMALVSLAPEPLSEDGIQRFDQEVLLSREADAVPWASAQGEEPLARRAFARADIDGDGLEELAVVFWDQSSGELFAQTYEDSKAEFAAGAPLSLGTSEVLALAIEGGDFDGDGDDELAVALATSEGAQLWWLERGDDGALAVAPERLDLPQVLPGSTVKVALAAGNLDYDPADELALLVNEQRSQPNAPTQGMARYHALDDANHGFAEVASAEVEADTEAGQRSAVLADLAMGDVDGDNVDELILAGLTHLDPDGDCDYGYLAIVLDDYKRALAPLGVHEQDLGLASECAEQTPLELRHVHVNALDVDGDLRSEIQINRFIYDDFVSEPAFSGGPQFELDPRHLYGDAEEGYTGRFDQARSAMVTGDFTGDGREDVAVYSQSTHTLEVWGIAEPDQTWSLQSSLPLAALPGDQPVHPVLVAPNTNVDGVSLSYASGEHALVFTQPIIIAALAAAPCYEGLGQNLFSCRTKFGSAQSDTVTTQSEVSLRASAKVGFATEFSFLGLAKVGTEVTQTVEARASLATSNSYTLTKSISYTTGPIEDTVIFTTIPYDQYTYTVISHPDESLIGAEIVVSLPRTPIELQVTREFYNEHVEEGGVKVDESIFGHVAGDPLSYLRPEDKDALLVDRERLEVGPQAVGQGGGNESLGINVYTETGATVGWGASFTTSVSATAGVVVTGFEVGFDTSASLQVSHGEESQYTGTVSNLPAEHFADHGYEFGLFTYVHEDPSSGQQFEVVNYWVQ